MKEIPRAYDHHLVEEKWYDYWFKKALFHAEVDLTKRPYTIVLPPPNISGALHMGHALQESIHDILIRWKRMEGFNSLWLPGTDHASISTQNAVERVLAKEGLTRHDLGREKFLERVWGWKKEYGNMIVHQLKRLGCSCDWNRERFTMDEVYSAAVREAFVKLYEEGLIYRGVRVINWCPRCYTAISDIEVTDKEVSGHLWYIRYPFEDGSGYVTIATTRPETMLGDTAVVVNPEDKRYTKMVGKTLILPILGRKIPLLTDPYADPSFGTGAVKVTPAHDPNDFEVGLRHSLPSVIAIGPDAKMTPEAGEFVGLDRYVCREALLKKLKEEGYLVKTENYLYSLGTCQRCETVIEPLLSEQWFVKMKEMAEPAIEVVEQGKVKFVPERFAKICLDWMANIRDWCISRQLWWGHRIPVWKCSRCGGLTVPRVDPVFCSFCGSKEIIQDPDILDTWFSSALWPFATMGWPKNTEELNYFYPTDVLITARDILFLWVARMIMMSLKFLEKIPFREVLVHPTIQTQEGRRMSRTLGTGIDPLELMEDYGTDATRFGLILQCAEVQDIRFSKERIESAKNFVNKIWNAARLVRLNLNEHPLAKITPSLEFDLADRWILSRYNRLIQEVKRSLENYRFNEAAKVLYDFLWHEYCDWYLEMVKPKLSSPAEKDQSSISRGVMLHVLEGMLRLLHPFMPFVTEEIWQSLPKRYSSTESISISSYPQEALEYFDEESERKMERIQEVITTIRNLRAEMNIPPPKKTVCFLKIEDEKLESLFHENQNYLLDLAKIETLNLGREIIKPKRSISSIFTGGEVYLPLEGVIDLKLEKRRVEREVQTVRRELERVSKKLADHDFLSKAPEEVIEKEKQKEAEFIRKKERLEKSLKAFQEEEFNDILKTD